MKFETGAHGAQRMNIYDCSDPKENVITYLVRNIST